MMHPEIKEYVYQNMFDESISVEECKKKNLPYTDKEGRIYNSHHFCKAANTFLETHSYQTNPQKSKGWTDFWKEERRRCREGYKVGQVRVTGYNYYFLNYYPMMIEKDGEEHHAFPHFWLHIFYMFHLLEYAEKYKLDLALMKVRGCGLSEWAAAIGSADYLITNDTIPRKMRTFKTNGYYAADSKYLSDDDAVFTRATKAIEWANQNCEKGIYQPNSKKQNGVTSMVWKAGIVTKQGEKIETGGSLEGHVLVTADKVRGGRKSRMFFEESGANQILGKTLVVSDAVRKRGGKKIGIRIVWGTANEDSRGIDAFKKVLTEPRAYGCITFKNPYKSILENSDNVLDISHNPFEYIIPESVEEPSSISHFIPAYDLGHRDKDGNPYRLKNIELHSAERRVKEKGGQADYLLHVADNPFTFEEALMKRGSNRFDKDLLSKQEFDIVVDKKYPKPRVGKVVKDSKGYKLEEFRQGSVEWIEEPLTNGSDVRYRNLYVIGYDGIDSGIDSSEVGERGSQMCAIVYKRTLGIEGQYPVAIYLERPRDERTGYETVLGLAELYNCKVCIEYSKIGILGYFRGKGKGHLMYGRPKLDSILKHTGASRRSLEMKIGVPVGEKYIEYGLNKIKDYIIDNWSKILFPKLLDQLLKYSYEDKRKFDMVAALAMALIADDDMRTAKKNEKEEVKEEVFDYYYNAQGERRWGIVPEEQLLTQKPDVVDYYDSVNHKIIYR